MPLTTLIEPASATRRKIKWRCRFEFDRTPCTADERVLIPDRKLVTVAAAEPTPATVPTLVLLRPP